MLTRRRLIHAGCLTTAVTLAPSMTQLLDVAEARVLRGSPFVASGFNGGLSQVNVNVAAAPEFPFADFVNLAGQMVYTSGANAGQVVTPQYRDGNGYPTQIQSGGYEWQSVAVPVSFTGPSVPWTFAWTGNGTLTAPDGTTQSGTNGSYAFTLPAGVGSMFFGVQSIGSPYISKVSVYPTAWAPYLAAGFSPPFLTALRYCNFGVIRFLNWGGSTYEGGNQCGITTWSTRKPQTYFSWSDGEVRANLFAGTATTSDNITYTLTGYTDPTYGSGGAQDKETFHCYFPSNCFSNATGTASGTNLTLSGVTGSTISAGATIAGIGIPNGTTIVSQTSGTPGGAGVYVTSQATTASSASLSIALTFSTFVTFSGTNTVTWGASLPVSSGTYNSTTGVVTLTLSNSITYSGGSIIIPSLAGTGTNLASLEGTFTPTSVSGNTITYNAGTGLGSITVTGGTAAWTIPHGFSGNEALSFYVALPTGLISGANYYVLASGLTSTTCEMSLTPGGTPVAVNGSVVAGGASAYRMPILSLNGTAYPIRYANGTAVNGASSLPAANTLATMVFDYDLQSFLMFGGSNSTGYAGIQNGVPVEKRVTLANLIGAHIWEPMPYLAMDPQTNFPSSYMGYVRANCSYWQQTRWETPNELWNFAGAFFQSYYAWMKQSVHTGAFNDQDNWIGYVGSMLGQTAWAAYGSQTSSGGTKLIGGIGGQAGSPPQQYRLHIGVQSFPASISPTGPSQNATRFTSAAFVAGQPTRSGFTNTAASFWMTHINTTSYYQPSMDGTLAQLTTAVNYAIVNANNPTAQAVNAAAYIDTLATVSSTVTISIASPAIIHWPAHPFEVGSNFTLATTGGLPSPLAQKTIYSVSNVIDANNFNANNYFGGGSITTTGSQSGVHTGSSCSGLAVQQLISSNWLAYMRANYVNGAGNLIGCSNYESGPAFNFAGGDDWYSAIAGATNATNCVLTLNTTTSVYISTLSDTTLNPMPGNGAVVGGVLNVQGIASGMTQLNCGTFDVAFTNGSANITLSGTSGNPPVVNQGIIFPQISYIGQAYPSEVTPGLPYYVVSVIGSVIQISATRGGSAIIFNDGAISIGANETQSCWFITNVSGFNVTLDCNSSAFGTWSSGSPGTAYYAGSGYNICALSLGGLNTAHLQGYNNGGYNGQPGLYDMLDAIPGFDYPSQFNLSTVNYGSWGLYRPDITASPPPVAQGIHAWN